ncbi:MAG: hypothetical protein BJ554DRAFT_3344, partial [Olpidium bornovanus]
EKPWSAVLEEIQTAGESAGVPDSESGSETRGKGNHASELGDRREIKKSKGSAGGCNRKKIPVSVGSLPDFRHGFPVFLRDCDALGAETDVGDFGHCESVGHRAVGNIVNGRPTPLGLVGNLVLGNVFRFAGDSGRFLPVRVQAARGARSPSRPCVAPRHAVDLVGPAFEATIRCEERRRRTAANRSAGRVEGGRATGDGLSSVLRAFRAKHGVFEPPASFPRSRGWAIKISVFFPTGPGEREKERHTERERSCNQTKPFHLR